MQLHGTAMVAVEQTGTFDINVNIVVDSIPLIYVINVYYDHQQYIQITPFN